MTNTKQLKAALSTTVGALLVAVLLVSCTGGATSNEVGTPSGVPVTSPASTTQTPATPSSADAEAALASVQSAAASSSAASAAAASSQASAQSAASVAAAQSAACVASEQSAAASVASGQAAAEERDLDNDSTSNLGVDGWYDERGWVSPETAARALAAGISPGETVPNYLRCGTICGESPTSGEIQQQHLEEQGLVNPDGSLVNDPCSSGYKSGDTCYPDYDSAAQACGGYLIRSNCYPSAEAARAAGEGE